MSDSKFEVNGDFSIDKLKAISIRLPEGLIEELKTCSQPYNVGYQTLIREILKQYVIENKQRELTLLKEENKRLKAALAAQSSNSKHPVII